MGILNKFKKDSSLQKDRQFIAEDSMADKVQDDTVEPGIPQDLSVTKKNNMGKVALAGIGLFAVGLIVAGLIAFTSRQADTVAETKPVDEIRNNQPKDFEQDKSKLTLGIPELAHSEASAPETVDTAQAGSTQTEMQTAQTDTKDTPPDRRLTGNVLVALGSDDSGQVTRGETSTAGLSGSENGTTSFADRLKPTTTFQAKAHRRADSTYLLSKGTNIPCTLDTEIITTHPGFTRCLITKDVYSANGQVLLLERGSKLVGEQTAALVQGQARVFVLWNEVETPYGIRVNIASPGAGQLGAGQLGAAGHDARVNYHFFLRFGGAMLISLISDLSENLNSRKKGNNNISFENANTAAEEMATEALKNSINIPPTGYVNQGTLINVMVSRDVDFSGVYEVVTPPYGNDL